MSNSVNNHLEQTGRFEGTCHDPKRERDLVSLLDSSDDEDFAKLDDSIHAMQLTSESGPVDLLTDDPSASSSSSSSSPSPSSSSSLSSSRKQMKAEDDSADDPFEITATSAHSFSTYADLLKFVKDYAAAHGFEIRLKLSGGEDSAHHGGVMKCWCCAPSPPVKEEVVPSHKPLRKVGIRTSAHNGKQIKCGVPA
jgi:hypothetical protein